MQLENHRAFSDSNVVPIFGVYVCLYVCMCEPVHMYACVCVYMSVYVCAHACMHMCAHTLRFISALHYQMSQTTSNLLTSLISSLFFFFFSLAFSKAAEHRVYHALALDSGLCIVNGGFGSRKVRGGGIYLLSGFPRFARFDLLCHSD